tara:strand:+ start:820 stop:1035 length:216 start_codon:yes stop_codon:yes gene_type:complete
MNITNEKMTYFEALCAFNSGDIALGFAPQHLIDKIADKNENSLAHCGFVQSQYDDAKQAIIDEINSIKETE